MLEGIMILPFQRLNWPAIFAGTVNDYRSRSSYRTKSKTTIPIQGPSISGSTEEDKNLVESKKITGSAAALTRSNFPNSLLCQENTVGIIDGVSALSTLVFLEKLIWWSSRNGKECVPFIVCSDPAIRREFSKYDTSVTKKTDRAELKYEVIVQNLRQKRAFLEQSGARCIVVPCHVSQVWYREVSNGCSVTFFNVGDCVARELKEANLRPLEAGSEVRIGVLARDATLIANFYQERLRSQGFEVVRPDKPTMEHIVIPAIEALNKRDIEGARNLLRIAIQVLLVRAVNTVILASDELQALLPRNDPLLKKCIDPMDALARSTIQWARSMERNTS